MDIYFEYVKTLEQIFANEDVVYSWAKSTTPVLVRGVNLIVTD